MSVRCSAVLLTLALLVPAPLRCQTAEATRPPPRTSPPSIGFKVEPSLTEQLLRTGASLGLIGLSVVGAAYVYRNLQRQRVGVSARRLKVVETLALAPKTRLFLIELDNRAILLGQHGAKLSVLSDGARPQEVSDPPAAAELGSAARQ
jgi:flagellar biogenesis protein FliO